MEWSLAETFNKFMSGGMTRDLKEVFQIRYRQGILIFLENGYKE